MLKLIVNDNQPVSCPICWEETDTLAYQSIMALPPEKKKSMVHVFSALTGLSYEGIMGSSQEVETVMYQSVSFVYNQPQSFKTAPRAKMFRFSRGAVMVPDKVSKTTVAQNLAMRQKLRDTSCVEECISFALAVYLQPILDAGPFDQSRAEELEKEVLAMNIFDTYPIGFFLLRRLMNSGPSGLRYSLRVQAAKLKRRLRQALNGLNPFMRFRPLINTQRLMGSYRGWFNRNLSTKYSLSFSCGRSRMSFANGLTQS